MATPVTLPALGESVTEGTVTRWLKQEGDQVQADEPLLEVSTDKVDTEIPAPASGTLLSITVHEDETVEVGAELGMIGEADEAGGGGTGGGGDDAVGGGSDAGAAAPDDQPAAGEQPAAQAEYAAAQEQDQPAASDPDPADQGSADESSADQSNAAPGSADQGGESGDSGSSGSQGGTSVTLPALGESVTEGTVTRWLKQEGDQVQADEPLLEVSTDKVDTEIPAPISGTLLSIKVHEDETVEVGAELAIIGSGDAAGADGVASDASGEAETQAAAKPAVEAAPTPTEPAAEQSSEPAQQPPTQQPPTQQPPAQQAPEGAPATERAAAGAAAGDDQSTAGGESMSGGPYVTPLVRKLASERGVDLGSLQGTGVGGRVRKQDVLAAADASAAGDASADPDPGNADTAGPPAAASTPAASASTTETGTGPVAASASPAAPTSPLRGRTEKLTRLRSLIARRMVESLQVSAQLTTVVEVDLTNVVRLRTRAKGEFEAREGVKLTYLPFFAKAVCEALKAYPQLNASIDQDKGEVIYHAAEHLGVAVDTERGLLVATVHDAGDLNIAGLARKVADLAERTRNNKMAPDELTGSTFTLTNTGSRGALFDTPIIFQPQVAILGTGAVVKRPVVVDDPGLGETIAIRSMVYLALTYDHRLVDGADAARFLTMVRQRLEEGRFESELGI